MGFAMLVFGGWACWSDDNVGGADADSDTDTDTDADNDSDADTETETDTDSYTETDTDSGSHYLWHALYDDVSGLAVDSYGNIYRVGSSGAPWTGPGGESPITPHSGEGYDTFVHKMTPNGGYAWHTFLPPGSVSGVAVDGEGGIVIFGKTSSSWTGPGGEEPVNDYWEIHCNFYVLKLDADGVYLWHTFWGYGDYCSPTAIAADGSGNIDVSVHTQSQGTIDPMTYPSTHYLAQFDHDGVFSWAHSYPSALGGRMTLDEDGNLYLTGSSHSEVYAPEYEEPLNEYVSGDNSFIFKLDAGGGYQWHTFYPTGTNDCPDISLDGSAGVFLVGPSGPEWTGPNGEEPLRPRDPDVSNLYVLKLDAAGEYQWHTFWGLGYPYSNPVFVAIGTSGAPLVTGSSGEWQGPGGEDPDNAHTHGFDVMALALGTDGSYDWHGFYGAEYQDHGGSIVSDGLGAVYITGTSDNPWDGPGGESPLYEASAEQDPIYFILKLAE